MFMFMVVHFILFIAMIAYMLTYIVKLNRITLKYGFSFFSSKKGINAEDRKVFKKYLKNITIVIVGYIIIAGFLFYLQHLLNKN